MNISEKLLNIVTYIGNCLKYHDKRLVALEENGGLVTVDKELSSTSENPVQNKAIHAALKDKQGTLISGENIKTINGQPILGSGNIAVDAGLPTVTADNDGAILQVVGGKWAVAPITDALPAAENNTF